MGSQILLMARTILVSWILTMVGIKIAFKVPKQAYLYWTAQTHINNMPSLLDLFVSPAQLNVRQWCIS